MNPIIQTSVELAQMAHADSAGVLTVKPRVFFQKVESRFGAPVPLNLLIPSSGIGSITMLEAAILTSLLRIASPGMVFEFGTFLGYSTALFLMNTGEHCKVTSIDLGDMGTECSFAGGYTESELHTDDKKNDDFLRYVQSKKGRYYLSDLEQRDHARLRLLHGDSRQLDTHALGLDGNVDFVFIDGGHELSIIESDTQKALSMIGPDGIIVWHDFKSTIHTDVTTFMQGWSNDHLVLHAEHTMLAIFLIGAQKNRFLEIGQH